MEVKITKGEACRKLIQQVEKLTEKMQSGTVLMLIRFGDNENTDGMYQLLCATSEPPEDAKKCYGTLAQKTLDIHIANQDDDEDKNDEIDTIEDLIENADMKHMGDWEYVQKKDE